MTMLAHVGYQPAPLSTSPRCAAAARSPTWMPMPTS